MAKQIIYKFLSDGYFTEKIIGYNETNLAIAKKEAYNGEYSIGSDDTAEEDVTQNNTIPNENTMTLEEYKAYRIVQSKDELEKYLDANPITSTAHAGVEGVYSITKEKQNLMSQQYLTYQIIKTVDPENAVLTWNERGGICEPWTEAEFVQLIMEIKAKVYPLVSYQQHLEKQITDSTDKAEIKAIVFDYDNAAVSSNG